VEVTVLNRQRFRRLDAAALAAFLRRLARAMPPGEADRVALCLVSDPGMRRYNREFRGADRSTDVLAFPGEAGPLPEGGRHLGDIVVSVPRAAAQAREAGHALGRELRILILHGYLHLLGFDHHADGGRMMRLQARLLRRLLPLRGAGRGAR
jgi:probable rRNA maturation factor